MLKILRHTVGRDEITQFGCPEGARIIAFRYQQEHGEVSIWTIGNTNLAGTTKRVVVVPTGQSIDQFLEQNETIRYIDTAEDEDNLMWHAFEIVSFG